MKVVLPSNLAAQIEPHLSNEDGIVRLDLQGNLDSNASDAEVYFHEWSYNAYFERVVAQLPNLRWLHTESAGIDHLLTPALLSRDLIVTNSARVHAIPIAEFVLAYMLDRAKCLSKFKLAQQQNHWLSYPEVEALGLQELMDATVLIIGAGGIGQAIATRAKAFGMRVWGSCLHPRSLPGFDLVVGDREWCKLLPEVDYVILATPLTAQTKHLIDAEVLQSMPASAYLINIARGEIIDENALIQALQKGWIAGAALDAFAIEPLPSDSQLRSLPNLFITPHCSGISKQMQQRVVELFLENLTLYRVGKPLRNIVDKAAGY
jgi:phosphoglycerate dehydrogenase-like enzyme